LVDPGLRVQGREPNGGGIVTKVNNREPSETKKTNGTRKSINLI